MEYRHGTLVKTALESHDCYHYAWGCRIKPALTTARVVASGGARRNRDHETTHRGGSIARSCRPATADTSPYCGREGSIRGGRVANPGWCRHQCAGRKYGHALATGRRTRTDRNAPLDDSERTGFVIAQSLWQQRLDTRLRARSRRHRKGPVDDQDRREPCQRPRLDVSA